MELTERGFGFSEAEFNVLCNVCEIKRVVCFEQKNEELTEEEVYRCIINLVERKILVQKEDSLAFSEEAEAMFGGIADRTLTCQIHSGTGEFPDCCFYVKSDGSFVMAEPGARDEEYVILKHINCYTFYEFLEKGDYIPKAQIPADIYEIKTRLENTEIEAPEIVPEKDPNVKIAINVYFGSEDENEEKIYFTLNNGNELLITETGENKTACYYSEEKLISLLKRYTGVED